MTVDVDLPTHPDLLRMREPDASPLGEGKCERCLQVRPLFLHSQVVSYYEEHDCPDCDGHDEEETRNSKVCPRCYSDLPLTVDER